MHIETRHGILRNICDLIVCEVNNNFKKILISTLCLGVIACGGGGGGESTTNPQQIQLVGSVGDGPVIDATITVTDSNGDIIATSLSDATASYSINIPDDSLFPVTITATGGTDIVTGDRPDFTMSSTIVDKQGVSSNKLVANINPFTTFMVKMSHDMQGGLNRSNLGSAKQILLQKFNFGFNADIINDPINSQITPANVAGVVKASEAMGEMIRRTRNALVNSGSLINGDDVITALSSDLADGIIDGIGNNANAKLTATAKIISAQVLLEVLGNRLKVNDSEATALLDAAIKITEPKASMTTANVMITVDLIKQTQDSLSAATRYQSSTDLSNIEAIISALNGEMNSSDVNNMLPAGAENSLDSLINSVSLASNDEIETINKGLNPSQALNVSPVITTVAITSAREGVVYRYNVNATDANSDNILTYSLASAPDSMSINAATGLITWTPTSTQAGTHSVSVRVTDNASPALSATQDFSILVASAPTVNVAPVISTSAITTARVGTAYRYDVNASDANSSDVLSYSLTHSPSGMTIDALNGIISWQPLATQTGAQNVTVLVTDNSSPALSVTQNFSIQVAPAPVANVAPVISTLPITSAQVGNRYNYDVNASDNNSGDTLSYALTSSPAGMSINASSGFITWIPTDTQAGTHNVTVLVSDNAASALSVTQTYTIQVTIPPADNVRPQITSAAVTTAAVGKSYLYDVNATDANAQDVLSYTLITAPTGMIIDTNSGVITWTPSESQSGSHSVSVRVDDNASPAMSSSQNFTISVSGLVIRVNTGGGEYVDSKGQIWAADYGYNIEGQSSRTDLITGTNDTPLYQSEHWHPSWDDLTTDELEYTFAVPNGKYAVILHFAEIAKYVDRIFDIEIEGNLKVDNLDIVKEVGRYTALKKNFTAQVLDGELNIRFPRQLQSAKVSAIEIFEISSQKSVSVNDTASPSILIPEASSELDLTAAQLSIIGQPAHGVAVRNGNDTIDYTPTTGFSGEDTIVYQFIDSQGRVSVSTLTVVVTCSSCTANTTLRLQWDPSPDTISGYRVYYGPDKNTVTELASDIPVNSGLINPSSPQIDFEATKDLNYYPGETVCFRVQTYDGSQSSALSTATCGVI